MYLSPSVDFPLLKCKWGLDFEDRQLFKPRIYAPLAAVQELGNWPADLHVPRRKLLLSNRK